MRDSTPATKKAQVLDALRSLLREAPPLAPLDSDTYARDHLAFETRSNQRRLITEDLTQRFIERGRGPISVLSVGCGDGTVDLPLARCLLNPYDPDRQIRYVGVDPYESGTSKFAASLAGLGEPTLTVETRPTTWADAVLIGPFDVITFVHSMYYVADVADAVRKAYSLLAPGGELLIFSGPRGEMNDLVDVCAPPLEGHRQWFSDDVAVGIASVASDLGGDVSPVETFEAFLTLEPATVEVLDFTVQAQLTPASRALVVEYLQAISVTDPLTGQAGVPHPVDVHRLTRRE